MEVTMRWTLRPLHGGKKRAIAAAAALAAAAAMLVSAAPSQAVFYEEPIDGPTNSGCTRAIDGRYYNHGESYTVSFWTPYGVVSTRYTCLDGVWHH
jgi:hypothetical protein